MRFDFLLQLRELGAIFNHMVNLRLVENRPSLVTESICGLRARYSAMAGLQTAVQTNPAASSATKCVERKTTSFE